MAFALEGIKVLDLTRVLAGPYATMVLGDLGADIIKLEIPSTGDDSRMFGPFIKEQSAYFMSLNRNKRSMTLNLKTEEGIRIFKELVKKVDVVVENFKPGTMDKLGLGYDTLIKLNPRLIYASSTGFGQTGPYSKKPAYDGVIQAMSGIMSITGPKDGEPTRVGPSIADITAGLFTAIGILAALTSRQQTGAGQMVDVSMLDCQVAILENAIARYQATGEVPTPIGNRHASIVPFEPFETSDGTIVIAVGNDKIWKSFCKCSGLKALAEDGRFMTNADRSNHYSQLRPIIADRIKEHTTSYWQALFDNNDIPSGPISGMDEVLKNEQVLAREMLVDIMHPVAGMTQIPGIPIKLSTTPGKITRPAPLLGEHTEEVLKEMLQMEPDEVEELRKKGIL
ncbi:MULTISPECIES: CaiB/BaiF CoA-transferase family protein [unclassified Fusibacter]|uniref:CaiB/BaiF CoA transferase family protein n=1 Tax=unclassified Fusibacter TaxID=2624464 RepID=UPI001010FD15|nr:MULTISPECIES: CoA transferase [unclassified Fusibacter]MCK8058553.1 CoA transferase [Fusibacter sp. A2]NPE22678.1 CoA transferase [Fusibacter sp. A1]RXV60240.1 CoA transferase [Fusibacter sp. A1]